MTSNQEFIIALLTFIVTIGLPALINFILVAQKNNLQKVKVLYLAYEAIIDPLIKAAEAIYTAEEGDKKLEYVIELAAKKINVPADELRSLIEAALVNLKLTWGEQWDNLETPTTPPTEISPEVPTIIVPPIP